MIKYKSKPFKARVYKTFYKFDNINFENGLIDIYHSKFKNNNKWIWFVVVLLFNYFGAILYLLIGKQQKLNT
ncbi:PLDc_N domain-containing protein [Flavobacteriaceae bacterium 14752]|nr:PLDc_N domain-containing protein [Flavobacteriaceae bacterium 14752]